MNEQEHPYPFFQEEEESVLLTLVELLTAACEQEKARDAFGADEVSNRSLWQQIIEAYVQRLAHGLDPEVRQAVAAHPHTPVEILHKLSQDDDPMVRKVVAEQKRISEEVLRRLAHDTEPMVRVAVARQERTPEEVLYALAQDEEREVRLAVARRSDTPVAVLSLLTQDTDAWNRRWAITHSHIPVDILCALAEDTDACVRCAVAEHPNTPVRIFHQLCLDPDERVRCSVAGNPRTPVELLRTLAQDEHALTRAQVASHPQTPGEILRLLAQDEDERVRCSLLRNPHIPMECLLLLSLDQDQSVRLAVASHPQTPEETLRALAQGKERNVRRAVARNPQTSEDILRLLCLDSDEWVRQAVASHPRTPEEVLYTLARNIPPNREVHHNAGLAVAMHSHASAAIVRLLTHYPNRHVQWLACFVQTLLAEYGEAGREQAWWAKLRWLFVDAPGRGWIGLFSIETQLNEVATLEVPEQLRQVLITALAAEWKGEHTFAVTDKRDAATLLRDRLIFYKHLLAPFLPPVALRKLACSPHWEVRSLMALHKHTPWETRHVLSQDENRYVRAMARMKMAQLKEESAD